MLLSILWIIVLIFQCLHCTPTSESPNFYDIPFFNSSDAITITPNEHGPTFGSNDIPRERRIFGLDDTSEITFYICAPTSQSCEHENGEIQLCYFHPNADENMRDGCGLHFCSIRFKFSGDNMNITIYTKDENEKREHLFSSNCIVGYLTLFQDENIFRIFDMEDKSIPACGLSSVPFNNIQNQTAIYLRSDHQSCSPTVRIKDLVNEYFEAPTTTTITSSTTSTTPLTTITTTTVLSSTAFSVKHWIHSHWWGPILGALILVTITLFLCVLSCIFRSRSAAHVNKLYRKVLIRRHERKKEMEKCKNEEKHEEKPINEEAFLADTVNIIDEVMMKPESSALNEPEKIEPKNVETDVVLKVTSVDAPSKNEQKISEDGGIDENLEVPGTTTTEDTKTVDKKEEPSDDNWLQLDNQAIGNNSAKESDLKKLSKETSNTNYETLEFNALSLTTWEERAVDLESLVKIVFADLQTHGLDANTKFDAVKFPTAHAIHRLLCDNSIKVLRRPSQEKQTSTDEILLAQIYKSALLAKETSQRIKFLKLAFRRYLRISKDSNERKNYPFKIFDKVYQSYPNYFKAIE